MAYGQELDDLDLVGIDFSERTAKPLLVVHFSDGTRATHDFQNYFALDLNNPQILSVTFGVEFKDPKCGGFCAGILAEASAGIGGSTVSLGLIPFQAIEDEVVYLSVRAKATYLRSWLIDLDHAGSKNYLGGEAELQYLIFRATLGVLKNLSKDTEAKKLLYRVGLGALVTF